MFHSKIDLRPTLAISVLAIGICFASSAEAKKVTQEKNVFVDCNLGESVQTAVNNADGIARKVVIVSGLCTEDISVIADRVTITGDVGGDPANPADRGGNATIDGSISVKEATQVRLEFLTVTGDGIGISVNRQSSVEITGVVMTANDGNGLGVFDSSFVRMNNNEVSDTVSGGFPSGIFVDSESVLRFSGLGPNDITDNAGIGIFVDGAARVAQSGVSGLVSITGSAIAVDLLTLSSADFRHANLVGDVFVEGASAFRIQNSTFTGDVFATANSVVGIRGTTTFIGTLNCDATVADSQNQGGPSC